MVLLLWPCSRFLLQRVVVVGSFPFTGLDVQVLGCFCWMVGCRIGEADNPGPHADCQLVDSSVTITIANPSALYGKIDEVRAIDSDVVCFSETSHTESACCFLTKQFRTEGFSSFFSKCVPEKFSTSHGRISLRGEAIGTAIISRLPSRRLRFDMLPVFFDSCRICMCVSRLASREFLFVSVYGFTNTHTAHKKSTMSILLYALQVAGESGLPCIIAGDMNCSVLQQDGWKVFHDSGYVEAHDFVARRMGKTLPPTCRGATSFDTILLPPELQPLLVDAWVNSDHLFDSHDPLTLKFDVSIRNDYTDTWKLPRSWTLFNVPHAIVSDAYDQAMDEAMQDNLFDYRNPDWTFDEAIQSWSHVAEKAVSNAIARHHAIDPQRQPFNSLPPAYKGRGQLVTSSKPICSRPRGMKQEGYDPPCEAFNVKVKHKVKQTRRIQSLCHVLEKHPVVSPDTQRWHDLQLEWLRIKHAPGYGRSWVNWISNFPDIAAVPDLCPSVELLRDFLLLTKFDCDAYSRQLQLNRKNVLKFRIDTDLKEGFGKMTYSWLRKPAPDVITSVQTVWKSEARLVRLSSGKVGLRLCTPTHFVMHAVAKFGDATILPLCLQNDILTFRVVQGVIPTQGTLVQDTFACTGQELAKTLEAYWSPIWNRDAFSEQFTDHPWASIFDMVRDTQHGMTPMDDIDMSADAWYDTAQKLKPGKSVGVDGFHHEDILSLPRRAFEVWSDIIRRFSCEGFSFEMMRAKVVLLSKVADPQHIKDGRPITILGALVRFVTSHFARQIMKHWSFLMPPGLSGGLPGRGVADIVWAQQFELEKAKVSGTPVSGYTLDLSKAFNRLPRRVMRNLMILFGAPTWCVDFWIQSLANLSRTLCWNRQYHGQILSTTGAPEGDAMAVVGMAAISYAFMLALQRRSVTLFAYADNWSWLTPDVRLHVELCHRLVWFTNQCRLVVDFTKSWFWTTHSSHQKFLVAQQQSLPEGVELVFQKFAKDLGSCINYSKFRFLGCVKDRILSTLADFVKLQYMQIPMDEKVKRVQVALWPRALYGAELVAPSKHLFNKLRRAATTAITGLGKHAASEILCHFLFPKLVDPQLFTLLNSLRALRRVFETCSHMARAMVQMAAQWDGHGVHGPCSALAKMLQQIGWVIDEHGHLQAYGFPKLALFESSNKEIVRYCVAAWTDIAHALVSHRKGFQIDQPLDRDIMIQLWSKTSRVDRPLLLPYILGAFQSESVKATWDSTTSGLCPLCGQIDTKEHRLLHCSALSSIRDLHASAVGNLTHDMAYSVWAPIPRRHKAHTIYRLMVQSRHFPSPFVPYGDSRHVTFYTDGSADFANRPSIRRAAFGVVQDTSDPNLPFQQRCTECSESNNCNPMRVVSMSMCPRHQSVPRAELSALVHVAESMFVHRPGDHYTIFTDAQYVVDAVHKHVTDVDSLPRDHHTANMDIIQRLRTFWNNELGHVVKIKAHQDVANLLDSEQKWHALGNDLADITAKRARDNEMDDVREVSSRLRHHDDSMLKTFGEIFMFLADLSRYRLRQLDETQQTTSTSLIPRRDNFVDAFGQHAVEYLGSWDPDGVTSSSWSCPGDDVFQAISSGAVFAKHVWYWLHTLRWSSDSSRSSSYDWGVSWLELVVNFRLVTGCDIPIMLEWDHATASAEWLWPGDDRVNLLPFDVLGVARQIKVLSGCICQLERLGGKKLTFGKKGIPQTYWRFNFKTQKNGFLQRPAMLLSRLTAQVAFDYVSNATPSFSADVVIPGETKVLHVPVGDLSELGTNERRKHYSKVLKRVRGRRNA